MSSWTDTQGHSASTMDKTPAVSRLRASLETSELSSIEEWSQEPGLVPDGRAQETRPEVLSLSWNWGTFLLAVGKPRCSRGLLSSWRPVETAPGCRSSHVPTRPRLGNVALLSRWAGLPTVQPLNKPWLLRRPRDERRVLPSLWPQVQVQGQCQDSLGSPASWWSEGPGWSSSAPA